MLQPFRPAYRGFLAFCRAVRFAPEDHQRRIARMVFAPSRDAGAGSRGAGKSPLIAAVAVHHLLTVPDAAVYVAAASREQANVLGRLRPRVRHTPRDRKAMTGRIRHLELRTRTVICACSPQMRPNCTA